MRGLAALILAVIVAPAVSMELLSLAGLFVQPVGLGTVLGGMLAIPFVATLFGGVNALVFLGFAFFIGHLIAPGRTTFAIAGAGAGAAHTWCGWLFYTHGVPAGFTAGPPAFFWLGFMDMALHLPWWTKLACNLLAGWASGSAYGWVICRRKLPSVLVDPQPG